MIRTRVDDSDSSRNFYTDRLVDVRLVRERCDQQTLVRCLTVTDCVGVRGNDCFSSRRPTLYHMTHSSAATARHGLSAQQQTDPSTIATMSKQRSTLLPKTATMSNEFIVKNFVLSTKSTQIKYFKTCSVCFDLVERTKFHSTLLPKRATTLQKTATMSKQR